MARTRANVASSLQKNTRSFSFRVARELDLSGIIKRIEGKRKRKKEAYLFTKWRGIPLATAKNPKRPPREVRRFSFLSTFAFSSLLFTAEPNGSNENAVERARFVESFTLSWLRTRPEQQRRNWSRLNFDWFSIVSRYLSIRASRSRRESLILLDVIRIPSGSSDLS